MLVDRHNPVTAASFERASSIVLVAQTYFVQADGQKNLEQDPALQVTHVRDGAKTRKAAASRLRRNWKALFLLFRLDRTVERAELKSSASFETQLLLPAMFQVSVS
jgi:hypothetical protein